MAQTILYYPEINIPDGVWLRNAILYWDNVSSIVPYVGYDNLSPELLYLQSLGIYTPMYPQRLLYSEYADDFCDAIIRRIQSCSTAGKRADNDCVRVHKHKMTAYIIYEIIHREKVHPDLKQYFTNQMALQDSDDDDWLYIDRDIAGIYMKTLAEYSIKSSDEDIVLGTRTVRDNQKIYQHTSRSHRTQCCQLNLERCFPQPSMEVGYEQILDFKEKRADELREFQQKIRELERNIYQSSSFEEMKFHQSSFIESWENCSNDYKKALSDARITFTLGSFCAFVAAPFMSSIFPQKYCELIQNGAALLQIGMNYVNYKDSIHPNNADAGFSYILSGQREGIMRRRHFS